MGGGELVANVCPTGLFFETQPIEEGLFKQASSLQTHKHPSVCLQRKGDQSCICMRMRSPGRRCPCPSKASVAGGLCSSTCAPRAPSSRSPRPTARSSPAQRPETHSAHSPHVPWPTPLAALLSPPLAGRARKASKADRGSQTRRMEELNSPDSKPETEAGGWDLLFPTAPGSGRANGRAGARGGSGDPNSRTRRGQRWTAQCLPAIALEALSLGGGARPRMSF